MTDEQSWLAGCNLEIVFLKQNAMRGSAGLSETTVLGGGFLQDYKVIKIDRLLFLVLKYSLKKHLDFI